ncbi:MAG: GrpB family protein [Gaiellaceae bacterium]
MNVAAIVSAHRARILSLVPSADVRLTGSASIAGLSANDVDLVVLVDDVEDAANALAGSYQPLHREEWRDDWAAFREDDVDVVVTCEGTPGDAHHRLAWERLAHDPELVEEYRILKSSWDDYEVRKAAFFDRIAGDWR